MKPHSNLYGTNGFDQFHLISKFSKAERSAVKVDESMRPSPLHQNKKYHIETIKHNFEINRPISELGHEHDD